MKISRYASLIVLAVLVVAALSACAGVPDATTGAVATSIVAEPTTASPTDTPVPPTDAPSPPADDASALAVTSLQDVRDATIRIEAQGSFVDPEEGEQLNVPGSGSGFIIDPSGIAVTNNHVVTGAAFLEVWMADHEKPLNARILGVSECSDLAVIDLEGDGYRYLEWYDGPVRVGLDVYAAGYPLGDPEFTMTRGIISKERADGDTDWASVDSVIEHDASLNPGNSGGPLVTEDGKVVAVNYASGSGAGQFYAITGQDAANVLKRLESDEDVNAIGINGVAYWDQDVSGIWVNSVESGSPADKAGIEAGDLILKMEGLVLATDGTFDDYCQILRTRDPQKDTLSLEVLRVATSEYLSGQINGRPLEVEFSFADELGDEVADTTAVYDEYVTVYDDSEAISIDAPSAWSDVEGLVWEREGEDVGVTIVASSDIDGFYETWDTPGVFFGASRTLVDSMDETTLLDASMFNESCTYDGRDSYEDELYTGFYDVFVDCGGTATSMINLVATPDDRSFIMLLQVQVVSDEDLDALDHILRSFQVVGELP
ncbi:MAG: serine protease [Caldilineales bacterium]|nr:serine protease [Caldilineales bacterium]